jgi:hypothetical protein
MKFSTPKRRSPRVTPAFVLAAVALFVALTSGAYAARTLLTGANIKDGSITSRDIKDGTILSRDIKDGTIASRDIQNGTILSRDVHDGSLTRGDLRDGTIPTPLVGPQGPVGPIGPQGPAAHAPFVTESVEMAPGDAPRTVTTQAGITIMLSCESATVLGQDWATLSDVTATTDIGGFNLANGFASQPTGEAAQNFDQSSTFGEVWTTGGVVIRSFGRLQVTEDSCELSNFKGVVYS